MRMQQVDRPYFIILLLFIPSVRCFGTFVERERQRERESLHLCIIYACAHGRACAHVCCVGICV